MAASARTLANRRASDRTWKENGRTRARRMSPASLPEPTRGLVAKGAAIVVGYPSAPGAHAERSSPPRPRDCAPATRGAALRARADHSLQRRQGRRVRAAIPRRGDVRLHPGPSVGLHAAALRLVPDPPVLDLRPPLGGGRARADRRRLRDGPDRLADRRALAVPGG